MLKKPRNIENQFNGKNGFAEIFTNLANYRFKEIIIYVRRFKLVASTSLQHCSLHFHNYIDNPTRLFSNLYLVKFLDTWAQNRSFLYRRHTFHDRALSGNNERSRRERVVHRFRRNYSSHVSVEREKEKRRSYPSVAVCDSRWTRRAREESRWASVFLRAARRVLLPSDKSAPKIALHR